MPNLAVRRRLRQLYRSIRAKLHGWEWEKVHFESVVPLSNGTWSTLDGGEIWRRQDGQGDEYKQVPIRSEPSEPSRITAVQARLAGSVATLFDRRDVLGRALTLAKASPAVVSRRTLAATGDALRVRRMIKRRGTAVLRRRKKHKHLR